MKTFFEFPLMAALNRISRWFVGGILVLGIVLPAALLAEGGLEETLSSPAAAAEPVPVMDCAAQTALITAAVKNYYGITGDFELSAVNALGALKASPNAVELVELPESPCSAMIIHARYLKDGQNVGEVTDTFRAQWKVSVFVPRCQLARGKALDPSDFETQTLDRLAIHQVIVEPSVKLSDYELLCALPAGTPLTWNYLRAQPLVHRGALVDVVAEDGGLKVTTRAIATQDAGRGEQILMRNPTSNKQFQAYVVNENLVQIHF